MGGADAFIQHAKAHICLTAQMWMDQRIYLSPELELNDGNEHKWTYCVDSFSTFTRWHSEPTGLHQHKSMCLTGSVAQHVARGDAITVALPWKGTRAAQWNVNSIFKPSANRNLCSVCQGLNRQRWLVSQQMLVNSCSKRDYVNHTHLCQDMMNYTHMCLIHCMLNLFSVVSEIYTKRKEVMRFSNVIFSVIAADIINCVTK